MKLTKIILTLLVIMTLYGCSDVPPGHVGVKVKLYGTDKGVSTEVLNTGRYYMGMNEQLYIYPTFIKQYPFTKNATEGSPKDEAFYFSSSDGVQCDIDIAVQAQADPTKAQILFKTFQNGMDEIIRVNVRTILRDAIYKHLATLTTEELYKGNNKITAFIKIEKEIKDYFSELGLIITKISPLSNVRFPKSINDTIEQKMRNQQAIESSNYELEKRKNDAKMMVIIANAEAEANIARAKGLTEELLEYQKLLNDQSAIAKWNGVLPTTMAGVTPFITINK